MQILKILRIKSFIALTALNFALTLWFLGIEQLIVAVVLLVGILLNQLMLGVGIRKMFEGGSQTGRVTFLLIGKFTVLALTFIWALRYVPEHLITLIICYTFQLLILILSIKRKSKKI